MIQRYDEADGIDYESGEIACSAKGKYVLYADHIAEVQRLREQLTGKLEGEIVEGERKAYQYVLDQRNQAIDALREQVRVLREALLKARAKMAHSIGCASVLPTGIWAERGSINFDDCKCEIAIVDAALAAPEPKP